MASNESIFDKLNLSSGERRLVMFVLVVLLCALTWMVWGMIPDPGATQQKIDKAENDLKRFDGEIIFVNGILTFYQFFDEHIICYRCFPTFSGEKLDFEKSGLMGKIKLLMGF